MSRSTTKRSDALHMAKCKKLTYYYCRYYGGSCFVCPFGINIKRRGTRIEINKLAEAKDG